ncbi:hypothetical protein OTU49_015771 [Cherax quadricarinatus]|uniref:C2H2-type domain-containing protein n=1 Tax=Cherax quadricarinatus TaxID=27406 RepID=A0AAW0XY00_CHEQU
MEPHCLNNNNNALCHPSLLPQLPHPPAGGSEGVDCPICGVHFSGKYHKYNLKRHLDIHRGVRPYSCKHCGHQFNRRHNLDRHLERVHSLHSHQHTSANVNLSILEQPRNHHSQPSTSTVASVDVMGQPHSLQSHISASTSSSVDVLERVHSLYSQPSTSTNPNSSIMAQNAN